MYNKRVFKLGFPGVLGEAEVIPWMGWETVGPGYTCDESRVERASGGGRSAFISGTM